jgi:hypothetical protein
MPTYLLFQLHPQPGQALDAVFDARFGRVGPALRMGLYRPVARLEATDLEDLFSRTNSIHGPWYTADGIELLVDGGAPSTSVGDIAIDLDRGRAWSCGNVGWEPVRNELCAGLFRIAGVTPGDDGPEAPNNTDSPEP